MPPPPPTHTYKKNEKKNGLTKNISSECLWCERWPVWGYVGVELAQSSLVTTMILVFSTNNEETTFYHFADFNLERYKNGSENSTVVALHVILILKILTI